MKLRALSLLAIAVVPGIAACAAHEQSAVRSAVHGDASATPPPSAAPPEMRYADAIELVPPDPRRRAKFMELVPKLDAIYSKSVEPGGVPGVGVGIVLDGEVVYAKAFGYRDVANKAPFEVDSLFRIASLTKQFTAMAVLKLRDEGKLSLDVPAATYYAPLAQLAYPTHDSVPITVRQLLTHGSGLPEDNYWVDAAGTVSDESLRRTIESGMSFSRAPNTGFEYSNTGYAILGRIIESVSGVPARDYIRREILLPLGMRSTVWSPDDTNRDRIALGYRGKDGYHGTDTSMNVAPIAPLGAFDFAGGIYTSIHDMVKAVVFQLSAWPPRDAVETGPIRRSSVREMQQGWRRGELNSFAMHLLPSERPAMVRVRDGAAALWTFSYGFGFFTATTCEDDFFVVHDGGLPGYASDVDLYPKRGFGIVTFMNDEREITYPSDEVRDLLRKEGVIDVLRPAPVPSLDAARADVDHLLSAWDSATAQRIFDPTFWNYQSLETFQGELATLMTTHGHCHSDGAIDVQNRTRGTWRMACDRGEVTFAAVLSPDAKPRLQTLLWEDSLPPSAPLERAATTAVGWIHQWNEAAAKKLLAPSVDMKKLRKTILRLSLDRGECRVDRALTSNGTTEAKFLLACADGAAELSVTIDTKTEKITALRGARPWTAQNCKQ